jgi:hypothetical protein
MALRIRRSDCLTIGTRGRGKLSPLGNPARSGDRNLSPGITRAPPRWALHVPSIARSLENCISPRAQERGSWRALDTDECASPSRSPPSPPRSSPSPHAQPKEEETLPAPSAPRRPSAASRWGVPRDRYPGSHRPTAHRNQRPFLLSRGRPGESCDENCLWVPDGPPHAYVGPSGERRLVVPRCASRPTGSTSRASSATTRSRAHRPAPSRTTGESTATPIRLT